MLKPPTQTSRVSIKEFRLTQNSGIDKLRHGYTVTVEPSYNLEMFPYCKMDLRALKKKKKQVGRNFQNPIWDWFPQVFFFFSFPPPPPPPSCHLQCENELGKINSWYSYAELDSEEEEGGKKSTF